MQKYVGTGTDSIETTSFVTGGTGPGTDVIGTDTYGTTLVLTVLAFELTILTPELAVLALLTTVLARKLIDPALILTSDGTGTVLIRAPDSI